MDSMVTPSVHGAGFATVASSGPNWAAYGASEAALATCGAIQASDVYGGLSTQAILSYVGTQDFRNELRHKDHKDPELFTLRAENQRLRDDAQTATNKALFDAIAAVAAKIK